MIFFHIPLLYVKNRLATQKKYTEQRRISFNETESATVIAQICQASAGAVADKNCADEKIIEKVIQRGCLFDNLSYFCD